ncbi:16S rRNA (guanine(527)-N(7))-methyltransferase RsmG [Planktomarina temperata]|nr:16S rRNA (guanine(527)-N(7))-methyltransferase RsmG [Planktomarina temperata]
MKQQETLASLNVSRETEAQLNDFVALVEKWNPVINLIAKGSIPNIWSRHIEDSAQIIALAKLSDYWIDIGSGGGFPGIVVAICLKEISPSTCVALVESDMRKATFLRQAAALLELNCEIHSSRIESLTIAPAATLSARALAPLPSLLDYAETLVEKDGVCLLMKGQTYQDELAAAQKSWSFEHDIVQSQTDSNAAVLKIRNIRRVAD